MLPARAEGMHEFAGDSEMSRLMRAHDWAHTPLGAVDSWPQSLKIAIRILLDSRYAMWLGWGPSLTFFYNDAYARMTLGAKHPWALGRSVREVWAEIWTDIGPRIESVIRTGTATWDERLLLFLERRGFSEETYHTFSYSPVPDDNGAIGGILCVVTEETERTIGERRLRSLRELSARTTEEAKTVEDACQTAMRILAGNPYDVPFALLYLNDADNSTARLSGTTGLPAGSAAAPFSIGLAGPDYTEAVWPLPTVLATGQATVVAHLECSLVPPIGVYPEPPHTAVVLPMRRSGQDRLAGFIVAGISPRRPLDDAYRGFLDLLAGQTGTAIANARAYEEEKKRAEALAELDRAKTTFFSNVSHEFRTPLTLMLGPVDELLTDDAEPPTRRQQERLEVAQRNALRLQKLVNMLLDFSRLEAGRMQVSYEPVDLAALTTDLASNFRSACEKAGLALQISCPPLPSPVYVDRDMWEKIVLNLVSNAFKYTLQGTIEVSLRHVDSTAVVSVRDSGVGIPRDQMSHLFERFHRVAGVRGRTQEGSGIGLALVKELVHLHGGQVAADSELGKGSTFTVTLPLGKSHLPAARIGAVNTLPSTTVGATPYVEEALRWLPGDVTEHGDVPPSASDAAHPAAAARPRILLADDNADMRDYIARLLARDYDVQAVSDGQVALEAAQRRAPDLILSDVMMPGLDGFALIRELRANPELASIPVLLLSARAGEEARVEGLQAGPDDYLTKPFSAKELLARVHAHLALAQRRRDAGKALRRSEWFHRLIADLTSDFTFSIRLNGGVASPNVDYISPGFTRLTGYTLDELNASGGWPAIVHPEDLPIAAATVERMIQGQKDEAEVRLLAKDGVRWVRYLSNPVKDPDGTVTGFVGAVQHITERKQAEETIRSLLRIGERLNSTLDVDQLLDLLVQEAIHLVDAESGVAGLSTPKGMVCHRYFQQGKTLPLAYCWPAGHGLPGWLLVHKIPYRTNDASTDPQIVHALCAQFGVRSALSTPILNAHGDVLGFFEIHNKDGGFTAADQEKLLAVSHAASIAIQNALAYRRIQQAEESLRDANRRKDEFLATLAHELRNPLAPIRNASEVLRLSNLVDPMARTARDMIDRQVQHMVRLIGDLVDVSRITRGKLQVRKERVELATILQSALEASRPLIDQQSHSLTVTLPPVPIRLDADPVRLAQVFSNLLNNAAKYTERGGSIWLTAECQNGMVLVSVRDTGIGIAADHLPHLFQMFSQIGSALERSQGGLGIGLALVRGLVELHGGSVTSHSAGPGKGSEFTVRLPILEEPGVYPPRARLAEGTGTGPKYRVLVADDLRDSAESLALMLRVMGHDVRTAHDGLEAVQAAAVFRPDVALLDIGMPKMNGYEAARHIRQQSWGADMLLVAVTGWGQPEDRRRSQEAGFSHHVTKPVDPALLVQLLTQTHSPHFA